jgi:5-deoxy-glucuronate isomerase
MEVPMSNFISIQSLSGLNKLPVNPCKLLDFQLLSLSDGETFESQSKNREILAVILGGKATITVGDELFERVGERPNVFAGKPYSVYIPCQTGYTVSGIGRVEIGLASAPSDLLSAPYIIPPARVTSSIAGAANFSRSIHQILTLAGQPDLPARRLIVGESFIPSGNWGTYPPHRHEKDDLPREAYLEEMYFFKINPPDGFGIGRHYNAEIDASYVARDNSIFMAPDGYHTVVSAPGYTTYLLWFMAGNQRVAASVEDPALAWVSRTVPMLRDASDPTHFGH